MIHRSRVAEGRQQIGVLRSHVAGQQSSQDVSERGAEILAAACHRCAEGVARNGDLLSNGEIPSIEERKQWLLPSNSGHPAA